MLAYNKKSSVLPEIVREKEAREFRAHCIVPPTPISSHRSDSAPSPVYLTGSVLSVHWCCRSKHYHA